MPIVMRGFGRFNPKKASVVKWLIEQGATKEWSARLVGCNGGRPSDMGGDGRYADVPVASNDDAVGFLKSEFQKYRQALIEVGVDPDAPNELKLVA
jgi:hypothetical protein